MAMEIKFRCFYRGQMYPVLELHGEEGMSVNGLRMDFDGLGIRTFSPDQEHVKAVMQYTGLKDKNGVEIYESDVFHMGDPNILYVVEWFDTGFQGRQISNKSRVGLLHWRDRINVTTNIYQNPELLNTKP